MNGSNVFSPTVPKKDPELHGADRAKRERECDKRIRNAMSTAPNERQPRARRKIRQQKKIRACSTMESLAFFGEFLVFSLFHVSLAAMKGNKSRAPNACVRQRKRAGRRSLLLPPIHTAYPSKQPGVGSGGGKLISLLALFTT